MNLSLKDSLLESGQVLNEVCILAKLWLHTDG